MEEVNRVLDSFGGWFLGGEKACIPPMPQKRVWMGHPPLRVGREALRAMRRMRGRRGAGRERERVIFELLYGVWDS